MFFTPRVLTAPFGRRYTIADSSFSASPDSDFSQRDTVDSRMWQLNMPEDYWRSLLQRYEYECRHLAISARERVADLLSSGIFKAYALPTETQLKSFKHYVRLDPASGIRYQLLPRNGHLDTPARTIRPDSLAHTQELLQSLDLSAQQISEIAASLRSTSNPEATDTSRIYRALLEYDLVITASYPQSRRIVSNNEAEESPQQPIRHSLGPHDHPDYVAPPPQASPVALSGPDTPAQSLEECETRLDDARKRLKAHGYQPKYSDEEIRAMADKGELDDRFIVRFTKFPKDDDYLSQLGADGSTRTWVTTFNQLENADTDPETLAKVLGIDNYDPNDNYSLIIVDTQAPGAGQAVTIVPTYENLGNMAKSEIKDIDPARIDEVMTDEYTGVYAEAMGAFEDDGRDIKNAKDIDRFTKNTFDNPDDIARFKTRARIQRRYGANSQFTGDGTTKNLLPESGECGVMEVLNIDKSPKALGVLEGDNVAKRLACKPL